MTTATNHSTRQMHVPTFDHPHCWTDPREPGNAPSELLPRQAWCWDAAAACGDAKTPWHRHVQTAHTPGCRGCSRRIRSFLIERGHIEPHPRTITNPQKRTAVTGGMSAA